MSQLLSVIMLSYNTWAYTRAAISHLLRFTDVPFRLIVMDNGSTDGSAENLTKYLQEAPGDTILLTNPTNMGFARGINRCLEESIPGSFIALVNSDLLVSPHWASRLLAHFNDTERVAAVGPIGRAIGGRQDYARFYGEASYDDGRWPPGDDYGRFTESLYWSRRGCYRAVKSLSGACLIMAPEALSQVGALDGAMDFGAEDLDWSIRARIAGYDLIMAEDTYVWHKGSASWNESTTKNMTDQAWGYFNKKWEGKFPGDWDLLTFSSQETAYPRFIKHQNCDDPLPSVRPLKLNFGSGPFPLTDYVNCDIRDIPGVDCVTDVRQLPFPNACAVEILASHLLEHLPPEDTERSLREWKRILAPGGKMVIIVPDLEYCAQRYINKEWSATLFSRIMFGDQGFNENLHRIAFDEEILSYFLRHIGLVDIKRSPLVPEWQLMIIGTQLA